MIYKRSYKLRYLGPSSEYANVYEYYIAPDTNRKVFGYDKMIDGKRYTSSYQTFETAHLAARTLDIELIKDGRDPINVLTKKTNL